MVAEEPGEEHVSMLHSDPVSRGNDNRVSLRKQRVAIACVTLSLLCGIAGAVYGKVFGRIRTQSDTELVVQSHTCCGRQLSFTDNHCRFGTTGSVCCASETALFCGPGDSCFLNAKGHPYCCPEGYTGCRNLCVGDTTRRKILARRLQCDSTAPPGIDTPGRVLYIDVPWDSFSQRYNFSRRLAVIPNPRFTLGTGDFTLSLTVTPRVDARVENNFFRLPAPLRDMVVLMSRSTLGSGSNPKGYALVLQGGRVTDIRPSVSIFRNGSSFELEARSRETWRTNVPVKIQAGRQGRVLFISVDGVMRTQNLTEIIDVDSGLIEPFTIGAFTFNGRPYPSSLDCYLSDISVRNYANVL